MPTEVIRSEDLRVAMSHLAQTAYATALTPANLNAGVSFKPAAAVLPELARTLAREGPQAFTGHEFPLASSEQEIQRDLRFSLNFNPVNSYLVGWAAAFALGKVTSVQEGATTHYTHTIVATDPIASGGTFFSKVTSIYLDSGGPDANRHKAIFPSLALLNFGLTGRRGELVQLSMDFMGSGKEDTTTAVTVPTLTSETVLSGQNFKVELGDKGAGLTDITERVSEWNFRCIQATDEAGGYIPQTTTPADGKFRSQLRFIRRQFTLDLVILADRSNTDIRDRVLNATESEVKITVDSGVVAGTGTDNHGFEIRIPACRLREAPLEFDESGAFYRVTVPENQIYLDSAIAASPCQITVENTQVSYLV